MKWMISTLVLLFAVSLMAQQQGIQPTSPSNDMPSVISQEQAPAMSDSDAQYQIQSLFSTATLFSGSALTTNVSDDSVTLTGNVNNEQQRDEAVRVAQAYAGNRTIVDNLQIAGLSGY